MKTCTKRDRRLCAVLLAILLALALSGCESKPKAEDIIRDNLCQILDPFKKADDALKNADQETIQEIIKGISASSELAVLGIDPERFACGLIEGFDYTIDGITVDGRNAEAQVTVYRKDLANVILNSMSNITEDEAWVRELVGQTPVENRYRLGERIMGALESASPTQLQINVPFSLENKPEHTWVLTDEGVNAIISVFISSFGDVFNENFYILTDQIFELAFRASMTEDLDRLKSLDQQYIDAMLEGVIASDGGAEFEMFGIDMESFLRSAMANFDYRIDSIVMGEETATVQLMVQHKNLSDALFAWLDRVQNDEAIRLELSGLSESETYQRLGLMMMEAIENAPPIEDAVELSWQLTDEGWGLTEEGVAALSNLFFNESISSTPS